MFDFFDSQSTMTCLQKLFWASNDVELIVHMAHLFVGFGIANAILNAVTGEASPYGRHSPANLVGELLPTVNPTLGWIIQESPAFLVPLGFILFGNCDSSITNKLLISMFMLHYFHRSFVYPFYLRNGKPMSLKIVLSAVIFCIYNGFMQAYNMLCLEKFSIDHLLSVSFIFGFIIFVCGFLVNVHSDYTLVNLRKPGETGYKIPKGGMFEYVSCANYFGEILEWWGFCIATGTYPAFAFAVFTTIFLTPRAIFHHRFYLKMIKNYPKNRKAVIPYLL